MCYEFLKIISRRQKFKVYFQSDPFFFWEDLFKIPISVKL